MSPAIEVRPLDDRGSVAWLLGAADPAMRASCALVLGAGTLVVDPVDRDGLDALLSGLPSVIGVVTLLDRHQRDAAVVAERLGAPRLTPVALGGSGVAVDGVEERSVFERRRWREALLWLPDRRLLVCAETLGEASLGLARHGDALGLPHAPRVET